MQIFISILQIVLISASAISLTFFLIAWLFSLSEHKRIKKMKVDIEDYISFMEWKKESTEFIRLMKEYNLDDYFIECELNQISTLSELRSRNHKMREELRRFNEQNNIYDRKA